MKFEDSKYNKALNYFKLEMPFGNYYLCETFFIGEINEGVHLDWKKVSRVIKELLEFYDENPKLVFITNRINGYSVVPLNWVKLEKEFDFIIASAFVFYNKPAYLNSKLESNFSKKVMKQYSSLDEAIDWAIKFNKQD